jgi:hypothetical protein
MNLTVEKFINWVNNKDNNTSESFSNSSNELSIKDYILFGILAIFCFLSFNHDDITFTSTAGSAFLNGHFLDFYDYNLKNIGICNYLPSTYILFAIWGLPLKLLGLEPNSMAESAAGIFMYYKILTTLVYLGASYLLYRISSVIGFSDYKAKVTSVVFLTAPIGFFSQFIFGQYDIFTVFFMLLGLYFFYKNKLLLFALFFGFAITFKYFAFAFFLPLLLLQVKNWKKIFVLLIICFIPLLIEILPYINSEGFRQGIFGFKPTNFIFNVKVNITERLAIFLVPFIFILICIYSYNTKIINFIDIIKNSLFILAGLTFACFGLIIWHPQWLLMAMPFVTLSIMAQKNIKVFLFLDLCIMFIFIFFTVNYWPNNVDESLLGLGIFRNFVNESASPDLSLNMPSILYWLNHTGKETLEVVTTSFNEYREANLDKMVDTGKIVLGLCYTFISSYFLIYFIYSHPKYINEDLWVKPSLGIETLIRIRYYVGVLCFVVPAFICLIVNY